MSNETVVTVSTLVEEITKNSLLVETNGIYSVTGEGSFDILMNAVDNHLQAQLQNNRIRAEDYSDLYVKIMSQVLQYSVSATLEYLLKKPITDAQKDTQIEQAALYKRQAKGFDDNAKATVLKELLGGYGIAFSVAKDDENLVVPKAITANLIDNLVKNILIDSNLGDEIDGSIGLSDNPFEDQANTDT